jgi:hypothetical protein
MAHLIEPDTLSRHLDILTLCAAFGFAAAACGKQAISYGFRQTAERYYLERPAKTWAPILIVAVIQTLLLLIIDSIVEQRGLLALVQLNQPQFSSQPNHNATNGTQYFLAAMLLTIGYCLCAAWEGYLAGRFHVINNRLLARQETDWNQIDTDYRTRSDIQSALTAIGEVRCLLHQSQQLKDRIAKTESTFDTQIEQLEASKPTVTDEISAVWQLRIQDAVDDLSGAQLQFDQQLESALADSETSAGWLRRFLRALFGLRRTKRSGREKR